MKAVVFCLFAFIGAVLGGDPNSSFLACCKNKGIQHSCQPYCSYEKSADA
uniref:Uncharacterized protein n=1 Tax=Panagrolaimus sp. ES5 TaxID=591445 RepID=A0AC34GLN8_9BILA